MFSALGNWLERSDEHFLKDLYTDAGRRYKIENLRRARLTTWHRVLVRLGIVVLEGLLCAIAVTFFSGTPSFMNAIGVDLFLLLIFVVCSLDLVRKALEFQHIDTQIKTLLLVSQLKTD